ncbi:unnamed protein product, partial [marine sediment metagenome]
MDPSINKIVIVRNNIGLEIGFSLYESKFQVSKYYN